MNTTPNTDKDDDKVDPAIVAQIVALQRQKAAAVATQNNGRVKLGDAAPVFVATK